MIDFYITLDYELYNGLKSGTVQNCLITPTYELLRVLDKYKIRAVFFVDACFLLRLRELSGIYFNLQKEYYLITRQIQELSLKGHDIQLHLHPNWYRASFDGNNWVSVMDDYKLSDIPKDVAERLINDGTILLKEITGKDVIAFRAGAYCLQTYKDYPTVFRKYGIFIDSSVNRNKTVKTEKWEWYDFSNIPKEYTYRYSFDVCKKDEKGDCIEFSIPNYRVSFFMKLKTRLLLKGESSSLRMWGDGKSSVGGALYKGIKKYYYRIKARLIPQRYPASIDGVNVCYLDYFFTRELHNKGYFMIMGHPKCFSPFSLKTLEFFLKKHRQYLNNRVFSE